MEIKALNEMKTGEQGKIKKVGGSGQVHRRILDMGVIPPAEVTVERIAPMGDPIWIRIRGYQLSLRREEAVNIMVGVE